MRKEEAIQWLRQQSPERFLQSARKRGWLCPVCGNGSGKSGDGIVLNKKTMRTYKCFKCGLSGDIIDLVGAAYALEDFPAKLDKACALYGISLREASTPAQRAAAVQKAVAGPDTTAETLEDYFARCRAAAGQTDFFSRRGLSPELVERFGLGFDPAFREGTGKHSWKAAILPTGPDTFEARNTGVGPNDKDKAGFKYRKHGPARLWNAISLKEEREKPVFVCEGILDALSVIQSGGAAVALSSAVNYPLLLAELDRVTPAVPLVLLLDEDAAGRENAAKLAAELDKRKVSWLEGKNALQGLSGGFHDANDRLLRDAEGLRAAVESLTREALALPSPAQAAKEAYLNTSAGHLMPDFVRFIQEMAARPRLCTGFAAVDEALGGGLFAGLYVLGAISSLGKTTFTLQIADQLARQGRDVLFFTLEQSRFDLMSKSVSRETFLHCRENDLAEALARTNLGVIDGRRWEDYSREEVDVLNAAFRRYVGYAKHLFFYEGIGSISVGDIREKVKDHISLTGNKTPVVFVDYLQILRAQEGDERATDKQIVDHNVTALKQLSRDFGLTVFAVSSLNRTNYTVGLNMAAFKESGAIEYGSDVLLGLQLAGVGDPAFDVQRAKAEIPRRVELVVLKNRNGRITEQGLPLVYNPLFNVFWEADREESVDAQWRREGFLPVEDEEDECPF